MPDPLRYLQSLGLAATVSAVCVLILAARRGRTHPLWLTAACLTGCGLGIAVGCGWIGLRIGWPTNALDRFVKLVIPGCLVVEGLAAWLSRHAPRGLPTDGLASLESTLAAQRELRPPGTLGHFMTRCGTWLGLLSGSPARRWMLRGVWIATVPPTLLFGSVHLSGQPTDGAGNAPVALCLASGLLLAATWIPLDWLQNRSPSSGAPAVALGGAILCGGAAVLLGGYIKGGAVACPLVGALAGAAAASRVISSRVPPTLIALGMTQLFGVLVVGVFFGKLAPSHALVLLLSPLACCVSELAGVRHRPSWVKAALQLALVAIPLALVVGLAKRDFDIRMKKSKLASVVNGSCRCLRLRRKSAGATVPSDSPRTSRLQEVPRELNFITIWGVAFTHSSRGSDSHAIQDLLRQFRVISVAGRPSCQSRRADRARPHRPIAAGDRTGSRDPPERGANLSHQSRVFRLPSSDVAAVGDDCGT